jgi:beta-lactamase class C
MVNKIHILFVFINICVFCKYNYAVSDDRKLLIQKEVTQFLKKYNIPGGAVIISDQNKPYLLQCGYANMRTKKLVTEDTIFEIGSISKIFTCLLLCTEILADRMTLQDSIIMHITPLEKCKKLRTVTLKKLCTHTSSLPFNAPDAIRSENSLLQYIARWRPERNKFYWQYSNHGIELIRIALEHRTKQKYNELLRNTILNQLGMAPIGVELPDQYKQYYAQSYDKIGEPSKIWDHPFLLGSAAIKASSLDMLKFLQAALQAPGVPDHLKNAMSIMQRPYICFGHIKQGLGWHISNLASTKNNIDEDLFDSYNARLDDSPDWEMHPDTVCDKTGTTHGFHAYIGVMPKKNTGIVIMINKRLPTGWSKIKKLGRKILAQLIKNEPIAHN